MCTRIGLWELRVPKPQKRGKRGGSRQQKRKQRQSKNTQKEKKRRPKAVAAVPKKQHSQDEKAEETEISDKGKEHVRAGNHLSNLLVSMAKSFLDQKQSWVLIFYARAVETFLRLILCF